jgi:hypothetical protein
VFAVGGAITMTPSGQEPVLLRIVEASENASFTDEADFGGTLIGTLHRVDRLDEGRADRLAHA